MKKHTDVAIVGAGILGIAHAYHAARAGLSVMVFDRDAAACGASIRNFGMLAIIAQQEGRQLEDARRSLQYWRDIASHVDIGLEQTGCLFLARHESEWAVLEEYVHAGSSLAANTGLLSVQDLAPYTGQLCNHNLLGAMWSPDAWKVDQRSCIATIAQWLQREHQVAFRFSTEVTAISMPRIETATETYTADHVIVCGGSEFSTLFPEDFANSGIEQCQLQMLATDNQPDHWQLKPFILGGLSIARYSAFADCSSIGELKSFQREHYPQQLAHGIHVIAAQEADGSVTIGDSHAYGRQPDRHRSDEVDELILADLAGMVDLASTQITRRWLGTYAYLPEVDLLRLRPADGVTLVTVTNGQGMTHGFAVAEDVIADILNA